MTYTMLPVRLREALIGGLLLSSVHIYLGVNHVTKVSWSEVSELEIRFYALRIVVHSVVVKKVRKSAIN